MIEFILDKCLRVRQRANLSKSLGISLVKEENKPAKRQDVLRVLAVERRRLLNERV